MAKYSPLESAASNKSSDNDDQLKSKAAEQDDCELKKTQWILLVLMWVFFFSYVGAEFSYGTYLSAFAVKSQLKLTENVGAQITSIFYGGFATMRFLSIFAAMYFRPIYIMLASCLISCLGSLVLLLYAEEWVLVLKLAAGVVGFGMASMYATGLLWLGQHIKVTNRIGASVMVTSAMGVLVFPVLNGQLIDTTPMSLMYLNFSTLTVCSVIFISANLVAHLATQRKSNIDDV